ncbi:MAG: zf-HC2 domain-containing protein [Deltaproteobacteria bacterium]|nr:zf-HC2 domain-containing protein [Deltaproteobacteria bacterium]
MAFLDDELAPEERRELELHLIDCAGCRVHVETERAELKMMRKALAPPPAPDLLKARLTIALDEADREATLLERRQRRSSIGRWILPGASIAVAAAAIFAFAMMFKTPVSVPKTGALAKEVVRQQARTMPLEVRGASTGTWLRENFAAVDPPQFRASPRHEITLQGARLTAVAGHNAAQLRYQVTIGDSRFTLTAVVIDDLGNDDLTGGTPLKIGDRTLHIHDANGIPAVTFVDEHMMGYAFAADRLSAQELLELVVSSDLIGRAQRGR